jgi:hypothetical protein
MLTKYIFLMALVGWAPHAQSEAIRSKNVVHTQAYKPRPERGQHIDIKVTPPGRRGSDGKVLVEVYNRSKQHLSLIQFDINLNNRGGFSINAPGKAEDLKPNLSGSQWVKIPKVNGAFPDIDQAVVTNLRCLTVDAHEAKIKGFVDLIKK